MASDCYSTLVFPKLVSQLDQLSPVVLSIPIGNEVSVSSMGANNFARVLNRTPVLFGPRYHFPRIANNTVAIATIQTVKLLDRIQVGQLIPIHNNVLRSIYSRDVK